MGDPLGAARHVRQALAPGGTWLMVEPYAGDTITDNLNPIGRIYYNGIGCSLRRGRRPPWRPYRRNSLTPAP
jgi:hypothetical protein